MTSELNSDQFDSWYHGAKHVKRTFSDPYFQGVWNEAARAIVAFGDKLSDTEAALAERDAEIKRLREKLELAYCGVNELMARHEYCECSDDPTDDICIGCNLKAILEDMRNEVPSEE